jgi:hypothetical protein
MVFALQLIKGLMDQSMDHGMFAVSPMFVEVRTNEDCRAEARSISRATLEFIYALKLKDLVSWLFELYPLVRFLHERARLRSARWRPKFSALQAGFFSAVSQFRKANVLPPGYSSQFHAERRRLIEAPTEWCCAAQPQSILKKCASRDTRIHSFPANMATSEG